jgi:hypothetical protein
VSAQRVGRRKVALASRETGVEFDAILRLENRIWEGRVLEADGHRHLLIDPVTWETRPSSGACWTSCATARLDSRLAPHAWTP